MTTRREFVTVLGAGVLAPRIALAQERVRRVAWFGAGRPDAPSPFYTAFDAGLKELGWIENRNLALTQYLSVGSADDALAMARDMLATNPDLVAAYGRDVIALHRAQPKVPVVFAFSGNPVDAGIVQSFSHPGGNMTGISLMSLELAGKRIELLKEFVPTIRRLGVLTRPEHAGEPRERAASEEVARKLGLALTYAEIRTNTDLDEAFRTLAQQRIDSLLVFPDGIMVANAPRIHQFALERRIATVSGWSNFADAGFLLTYGPNLPDSYKYLARYADRVLRGTKPADLPVELPRTVELVVNNRTARSLGIKIPNSILVRATSVIE